ncbi:MAG TPA: hypothetical protein PLC40_12400, partial [Candidatus Hydrogenedentes bacterium]|nr:hypothetical protein [Candidatus Hydrogenedentota bacterium]
MTWCNTHRLCWIAAVLAVILLTAGGLWLRMGAIEVSVDETALQALPATVGAAEFTILTYNVQARPWFDETEEKFGRMSPLMNRFDICAFQECFKDHHRL